MTNHPTTREQAISMLVEQDVAKWGESQRAASQRMHADRTIGLALNELANRAELADQPDVELRRSAKQALTANDWSWLKKGG